MLIFGKNIKFSVLLKRQKTLLIVCLPMLAIIIVEAVFIYKQHIAINNDTDSQKKLSADFAKLHTSFLALKNQDQYKINQALTIQVKQTHDDYAKSINLYQNILDLKAQKQDTTKLDILYGTVVKELADLKTASAEADLTNLDKQITDANTALSALLAANPGSNAPISNAPPAGGFSLQQVASDVGTFPVAIISADLNSTRVIVDTASDGDCANNCPVTSLSDYVSRSGAYAGINGSFFCPADYPSCSGKTNSFDTLLMNKNKKYFNSANNVYSTVPLATFSGNSARFLGRSEDWGRDTGVDAVIAMQPMLVAGGNVVYGGGGSDKFGAKGLRGFIANKGSTVYIGFVYNATMSDAAHVLKTMGLENAINLDEGGSSALWFGGYKVGPGRNIPNAVLFVRK